MTKDPSVAIASADGRFELRVEEFWERSSPTYTSRVTDRISGTVIFTCECSPKVEFRSDGLLQVHYPGYEPTGIVIDLAIRQFRTHESEPWVPLSAWPLVEGAYLRGWSAAYEQRQKEVATGGVWVEASLAIGSLVALLLVLCFGALLPKETRTVLSILTAVFAVFFTWLSLNAVRDSIRRRDSNRNRENT